MPFVTEEAWQYLTSAVSKAPSAPSVANTQHSLMIASYPQADMVLIDDVAERDWTLIQELIVGIRNLRSEYKVEPARQIGATIAASERAALLEAQRALIARLARVADDQLTIVEMLAEKPEGAATLVIGEVEVYVPLAGMIDLSAERARLQKELEAVEADVKRREGRLANSGFVDKAPAAVVQRERDGLAGAQATMERLRERLAQLG